MTVPNQSAHLTSADLDALLFDRDTAAAHPHLIACTVCSAELEGLRDTFAALRIGATAAAAHQQALAARTACQSDHTQRPVRLIASFATAVLALAIGMPIVLHHPAPATAPNIASSAQNHRSGPAPAPNLSNLSNLSDDQLLASVQSDLSASVPDPMLPLDEATSTQSK